jgi:hypothetical protein
MIPGHDLRALLRAAIDGCELRLRRCLRCNLSRFICGMWA